MVARLRDAIQRGTTAAKPAATAVDVGTLYFDTDLAKLQRSSGAAWEDVESTAAGISATIVDAKGDLIAATAADTVARLAVGTNDQVLTADSAQATGLKWAAATGIPATTVDAKGDILAATAADTVARLAVGTNDQVLTADSTTATGLKWAAGGGGGGSSQDLQQEAHGGLAAYVASLYYDGRHSFGATTTNVALIENTLYFEPFYSAASATFDRIGINVTTAQATGAARLGIYQRGSNGLPGALVLDAGTIDCTTTGFKEITISQALADDIFYWLAVVTNVASIAVTVRSNNSAGVWGASTSTGLAGGSEFFVAHTYGVLPNPAGAITLGAATARVPLIRLRAA